jgi:capsular polysaccharide biosynthesis protein/Mrp family chromosome partitioning ATPase
MTITRLQPKAALGGAQSANPGSDWIVPSGEERGFARYLSVLWGGKWIILVALLAALAGAGVYLAKAQKVYQAHSQLQVQALTSSSAVQGLGLIVQSGDPLRDVETAAGFVNSTSVAQRVINSLHLQGQTPQGILKKISVAPIAESDIVDIGASANSPAAAARLANAFAKQTVIDRTAALKAQLDVLIPQLRARTTALGKSAAGGALGAQLAALEALQVEGDPNLRVNETAVPPTGPSSPRKSLTVAAAVVGGLVVGIALVLLIQLLHPRVRREEELRERFRLPILARVPRMGSRWSRRRRRRRGPIAPDSVPPEGTDAFRALRTALATSRGNDPHGRIVLVTGGSPLDGKSTTAINLSAALASSGDRVILVEGDSRRPSIGAALNLEGSSKGLVTMNAEMPQLRMLLASGNGHPPHERSPSNWHRLLEAARRSADWVVVDAPPLIYAPDVLSASDLFDDVLLIVRLGNTDLRNLDETAEMLATSGIRPAGLVVVGTSGHREYY